MSSGGENMLMPPPAVPYTDFVATVWSLVALAGIALTCRLVARFRGPRRLFLDDGLVIFPWILSLTTAAVWQWAARDMYYIMNVQAALAVYDPSRYMTSLRIWLNASLIAELFFYTSLFSIKLSFLFFFRRLGSGINHFHYIWWGVLFITAGSYFAAVGNVDYKCLVGTIEQITGICQTKHEMAFTTATLKANAALDIVTDFLIMILPTILIWNTRIRWSKKFALIGLFSLSIITIVIATVRAVMVDSERRPDGNPDVTWLWFWSAIEPSVATLVCCGSAFPQLFTSSTQSSRKPQFSPSETYLRMMSRIRAARKRPQTEDDTTWLDLTAASQNTTGQFDSHSRTIVSDDNYARSSDPESGHGGNFVQLNDIEGNPVLVPRGSGPMPAFRAYVGTSPQNTSEVPMNQINQRFDFEVK